MDAAEGVEHLWDAVVYAGFSMCVKGRSAAVMVKVLRTCKGGDFRDVVEAAVAVAFEAGPQVCNEDLGTLVEADALAFEFGLVPEAGEVFCEQVHQCGSGTLGFSDACGEAALKALVSVSRVVSLLGSDIDRLHRGLVPPVADIRFSFRAGGFVPWWQI